MPEEQTPGGSPPAETTSPLSDDPYAPVSTGGELAPTQAGSPPAPPSSGSTSSDDDDDEEDESMLRMSFLEHLEELRSRLIRILIGVVVAYVIALVFANQMWQLVSEPAVAALKEIGARPKLAQLTPMDGFLTIYVKLPLLAAVFLASPWVLWQVWAFIAPGLYKKERRFAAPFVICSAGLFVAGGCFAYFVAFRLGLAFLLGIGMGDNNVEPVVSIVDYFDLFVNVTLGIGAVFELPILIFFVVILGLVSPKFLIDNSRYAILGIVVLAAVITPTPDAFNLTIFAVPMILLYFVGVFAGWIFIMRRDGLPFPWKKFFLFVVLPFALLGAGTVAVMILKLGFRAVPHWPFLIR